MEVCALLKLAQVKSSASGLNVSRRLYLAPFFVHGLHFGANKAYHLVHLGAKARENHLKRSDLSCN